MFLHLSVCSQGVGVCLEGSAYGGVNIQGGWGVCIQGLCIQGEGGLPMEDLHPGDMHQGEGVSLQGGILLNPHWN